MQRPSRAIDGIPLESGIIHQLEQIRRVIEDKFVAAGEILLKSLDGIDDLIQSLDRFAKAFDKPTVVATKADLTVAAAKLCTLPACRAHHIDHISQLSRSRAKLGRHISAMRCHLAFMGAFSRTARIMADATAKPGFAAMADGVSACVSDGIGELATLESDLNRLQHDLESATVTGNILERQIADLLPAVPEELTAAAGIVGKHYTAVAATTGLVASLARDIQTRVVRILAALQFGDITRQRIEHVQACLVRTEADITFAPRDVRARFRATCYALLARQLTDISTDFDREVGEIERNLRKMASDAKELLRLHDITFDRDGGKNSGFLHVLAARIDAANKLVATIEAADRSAIETGRATVETAHRLEKRIDHIKILRNQMRALASPTATCEVSDPPLVNATKEIHENGRLLEEAATVGLATLDKLLTLANSVIIAGSAPRPQDSKAAAAAAALAIAARRIREARDTTENDLVEVAAKGDAVVHTLILSDARLSLRREISDILAQAMAEAERQSHAAYEAGDSLPDALVRTLSGFAETYTMAPERAVQLDFLTDMSVPFIAIDSPAAEDTDTVLF